LPPHAATSSAATARASVDRMPRFSRGARVQAPDAV
jgi:hypothetical protein